MEEKKQEIDLIILSLSTLHIPLEELKYKYKTQDGQEGEFQCNGVCQLEPGTKYFIDYLKERNLKHIYIVNTAATRENINSDKIHDLLLEEDYKPSMTTVEFFEKRIKKYVFRPTE